MISEFLLDQGCSCHNMAPCSFCESLSVGEADAYCNGGMDGLRKYLRERRNQEEETAELNEFLDKEYNAKSSQGNERERGNHMRSF